MTLQRTAPLARVPGRDKQVPGARFNPRRRQPFLSSSGGVARRTGSAVDVKQVDPRPEKSPASRCGPSPRDGRASPWSERPGWEKPGSARPDGHSVALSAAADPPEAGLPRAEQGRGPFQGLPAALVERRLIRRAEALWVEHCPEGGLPPASALSAFAAPGFAEHSLLFSAGGAPGEPRLRPHRAGAALAPLLASGRCVGDPPAPLSQGLAGLAARALAQGGPAELEVEPAPAGQDEPGLLLRAIALPFGPARGGRSAPGATPSGAVLVVASWRQLLSAEETHTLHRELAQALGRLRQPG